MPLCRTEQALAAIAQIRGHLLDPGTDEPGGPPLAWVLPGRREFVGETADHEQHLCVDGGGR